LNIECETKLGFAVDEINGLVKKKKIDLVVMGVRGAGYLSEKLIGSITTATLREAKIPVLVIPEKVKYKDPKNIVFACDYEANTNMKSLDPLKEIAKTFEGNISIVNVIKDKNLISVDEAVTGVKLDHKLNDVNHSYFFPENDNLVEGINDFAHRNEADMIAIIPHRHNLIERLFQRSTSKKIAFHTDLPLLALPDAYKTVPLYA
jgi:nucleotide-binding universal stress UspA family protein